MGKRVTETRLYFEEMPVSRFNVLIDGKNSFVMGKDGLMQRVQSHPLYPFVEDFTIQLIDNDEEEVAYMRGYIIDLNANEQVFKMVDTLDVTLSCMLEDLGMNLDTSVEYFKENYDVKRGKIAVVTAWGKNVDWKNTMEVLRMNAIELIKATSGTKCDLMLCYDEEDKVITYR